jgi:hypothetical protein
MARPSPVRLCRETLIPETVLENPYGRHRLVYHYPPDRLNLKVLTSIQSR